MIWRWLRRLFRPKRTVTDGTYRFPGDVPFRSQRLHAGNREREGFPDAAIAEHWSERGCGIACIKMAVGAFNQGRDVPLRHLLDEGAALRAYREDVGWLHRGLAKLATRYGIRAVCRPIGKDLHAIAGHIAEGGLVIASVSVGFEASPGNAPGGHLVLIYGTTVENGAVTELLLHHPSSEAAYEAPAARIGTDRFLAAFSRRGNVILLS